MSASRNKYRLHIVITETQLHRLRHGSLLDIKATDYSCLSCGFEGGKHGTACPTAHRGATPGTVAVVDA